MKRLPEVGEFVYVKLEKFIRTFDGLYEETMPGWWLAEVVRVQRQHVTKKGNTWRVTVSIAGQHYWKRKDQLRDMVPPEELGAIRHPLRQSGRWLMLPMTVFVGGYLEP